MTDQLPTDLLNSLTSGILAIDLETHVLFVNSALTRRLGINPEACLGKPAPELFHNANPRISSKRLPLYRLDPRRDGHKTRSREVDWSNGKRLEHLREDSSPLVDKSGNLVGRLFAYHDLSWEKTIDQMKSDFISIASHELRTPMTSIKGSVDLMLGGCVGEVSAEAQELLEVAHMGCDRMIRLINNILDLSKIEAGQIQLKLEPIDLAEVAENCVRSLRSLAAQEEIVLKLESPEGLPQVEADRDRMEQVITNLVSNAIKFSPAKGEVTIRLLANNGWIECCVSDHGCGIEEKDLDRIFGKFQQAGAPQRGTGTGLGLAIAHALVSEHRGKIWVESRMGEGSRFVFCVPAAAKQK